MRPRFSGSASAPASSRRRCLSLGLAGAAAALASLLSLCPPAAEAAALLPEPKVAVVDYTRVLRQSEAGQDIHRQIEGFRKSFQDEIKAEEAELRDLEERLTRQRATLAPDEFDRRRREFEERVIQLQRRTQDSMRALDRSYQESMNKLHEALLPLVRDLTRERGFNVVIDNSKALIVQKSIDLTDEVLEQFNRKVPALKLPKPTPK